MVQEVFLKKNKEKAIKQKHHWIFSGAIISMPKITAGEILKVCSHDGKMLGFGYFNPKSSLIGRMISYGEEPYLESLKNALARAVMMRKQLIDQKTTGYRLINGEGDEIPGLIVDNYAGFLVMQIGTQGIENLKPWLVDQLWNLMPCKGIYEKSLGSSRKEEGMAAQENHLKGELVTEVLIKENDLQFIVNPQEGQKSGFFLDQRLMRQQIKHYAFNKKVLNCFCYTGGFSAYALAGGAQFVDSVDISQKAVALAERNMSLNSFEKDRYEMHCADVFEFLRHRQLDYQLVILDPPAFAKKKQEVMQACRGYKDINRLAMQKMPAGSLLLTCSCSYHVDEKLFQQVLFQAALEAGRHIKIIGKHALAADHPINIYHPEMDYLKSFLLYID